MIRIVFAILIFLSPALANAFANTGSSSAIQKDIIKTLQAKATKKGISTSDPVWLDTKSAVSTALSTLASAAAGTAGPIWLRLGASLLAGTAVSIAVDQASNLMFSDDGQSNNFTVDVPPRSLSVSPTDTVYYSPQKQRVFKDVDQWFQYVRTRNPWWCLPNDYGYYCQYKVDGEYTNTNDGTHHVGYTVGVYKQGSFEFFPAYDYTIGFDELPYSTACEQVGDCTGQLETRGFSYTSANPDYASQALPEDTYQYLLSPAFIAQLTDAVLKQAAAQEGYSGMSYSFSDPITTADVETVTAKVGDLTKKADNFLITEEDTSDNEAHEVPNPTPEKDTYDFGLDPNIGYDQPNTGDASVIFAPFRDFISPFSNFEMNLIPSQCQPITFYLPIIGQTYSIESHCQLLNQNSGFIGAVMLFIFYVIGIRIILSA